MDLKRFSIPAVVVAAITLAGSPALAQRRGGTPQEHEQRQSENRQAERRGGEQRAQQRAEQPRAEAARPAPRAEATPRVQPAPRVEQAPRVEGRAVPRAQAAPRVYNGGVAVPRATPRYDNRSYGGHYDNRSYGGHYDNRYYGGHYDNRYYYGGRYYGGPWRGYYGYAPYHPYYFRPRFSIGFGVYLGYPVPYYAYPYPVPVYGYGAPYGEVTMGPGNYSYGGIALEITPNDAQVYVDGNYAGVVADFDGSRQPLTLTVGTHHIEVVQNGFQPWAFDATVQPGMVTPYQGALQQAY